LYVDVQLMQPVHRMTSDVNQAAVSQAGSPVTVKTTVAIGPTNATAVSIYQSLATDTKSYIR